MANILHSALTGSELHECKGASTATTGQFLVANGDGTATFQTVGIPTRIQTYTTTASVGLWSITPIGFTSVSAVHATAISGGTALGTAAVASVSAYSTSSVTGSVIVQSASSNALGSTQTVLVTVIGS